MLSLRAGSTSIAAGIDACAAWVTPTHWRSPGASPGVIEIARGRPRPRRVAGTLRAVALVAAAVARAPEPVAAGRQPEREQPGQGESTRARPWQHRGYFRRAAAK